jgi:teichuronic acid biosynthesis glycosyltransferase TuaH
MSRPPGSWTDVVVLRAGTSFLGTRLADQHIAEALSARGVPVLYVDPPFSFFAGRRDPRVAAARAEPSLRLVGPNLARLTPRVPPGKSRPLVVNLADAAVRRYHRAAAAALGGQVRAVISVSTRPEFGSFGERTRIFWARDDYAAGAGLMNLPEQRVRRDETRMARSADRVVAVSPGLTEKWQRLGCDAVLVPNGCDVVGMAHVETTTPAADVTLPGPILGVVGTIGERSDLTLLESLAKSGRSILLVGGLQRNLSADWLAPLLAWPNVQWTGPRRYDQLPSYLRCMDVGLVPYQQTAFNQASFPLKTLEYLAAGLPVVSTDLPASRWLDTSLIRIASSRAEFHGAVDEALREGSPPALVRRRRDFAECHSWSRRADALLDAIG